jgi:DNA-binding CsgD family transcriptional regulator
MITQTPLSTPDVAHDLANALSSLKALGVTDRRIFSNILKATLEQHPEYWGVWTVWKPNALDGRDSDFANHEGHDATGRYAPLWKRTQAGLCLEPNVGYDEPGIGDYYLIPIQQQREVTLAPYEYEPAHGPKRVIMSKVAPIFHDGACVGVAGFDIAADEPGHRISFQRTTQDARQSPGLASLSKREGEVLQWVSQGKSNAEIGVILGISPHTVKHHMEKIFAKLGVENRHAAMLSAMQPFVSPQSSTSRSKVGTLPNR